jgi:hypothetical protein
MPFFTPEDLARDSVGHGTHAINSEGVVHAIHPSIRDVVIARGLLVLDRRGFGGSSGRLSTSHRGGPGRPAIPEIWRDEASAEAVARGSGATSSVVRGIVRPFGH